MEMPTLKRDSDPLLFWRGNQSALPKLANLARTYFGTPAASVYSERMFSELGNIYDERRNRQLLPWTSEKLLFLYHNILRFS